MAKEKTQPSLWLDLDCPPQFFSARKYDESRGDVVEAFCEDLLCAPNESHYASVGDPLKLIPWQRELVHAVYELKPNGSLRHNNCQVWVPKRQGKSIIYSILALFELVTAPQNSELFAVAAAKEQIKTTFLEPIKRLIELSPDLQDILKVHLHTITNTATGSVLKLMSSDAAGADGITGYRIFCDELHRWAKADLYEILVNSLGTVPNSQLLSISTAGEDTESIAREQYETGRLVATGEVENERLLFRCWEAPLDASYDDPATWAACNPSLGYTINIDDYEESIKKQSEQSFRRLRLNQWVREAGHWPIITDFNSLADESKTILATDEVVIGFDGSIKNDSTAIVLVRTSDLHIEIFDVWERPSTASDDWSVPQNEVRERLIDALTTYNVKFVAADLTWFQSMFDELAEAGFPIKAHMNSPREACKATSAFEELVYAGKLSHSNDARLLRHIGNCVLKPSGDGYYITKEYKMSNRKIDIAMATVIAVYHASLAKTEQAKAGTSLLFSF